MRKVAAGYTIRISGKVRAASHAKIDRVGSIETETLWSLSLTLRKAILRTDRRILPVSFHDFPRGSCGDACPMLGNFLLENGFRCPEYVAGTAGPFTHAWLEIGSLVIDITADQFVDNPEALVWVGVPETMRDGVIVSTDRTWHDQFTQDTRHLADIEIYSVEAKEHLYRAYRAILHNR
jgi:hypothetical protein